MEDEKIIGLYWERNEDAITETSSKYGKLFFRIASNILLRYTVSSLGFCRSRSSTGWMDVPQQAT